jgi:putative transcriptional regulator
MQLQPGIFLQAARTLDGTYFEGAVLFITEYNQKGALGYIINRPFPRALNELVEFRHSPAFPLYEGGPVDNEHLYFIHRRPDVIKDSVPVTQHIFWGGAFAPAVTAINNNSLKDTDIKIFIGYCGWDAGELEAEMAEGSWEPAPGDAFLP